MQDLGAISQDADRTPVRTCNAAREPRPTHERRAQGCRGCGVLSHRLVCRACRYTDRRHHTRVLGPGERCPTCGAEVPAA
jgi:hypothetical protein